MRRTASIISFVVALALIAMAASSWRLNHERRYNEYLVEYIGFDASDALARRIAEDRAQEQTERFEAIGGAVFLVAGLALWGKKPNPTPAAK